LGINRRIELPTFEGEDICEWLVRIERYFQLARVATAKKLEYVAMSLTEKALTWFEWWEEQTPFPTWTQFKQDILKRFQPVAAANPIGPLLEVKQHDTVMQYREEFELAARNQRSLEQDTLMRIFKNGLKEEIKAEMNIADFETLTDIMGKATVIEARNNAWRIAGITPGGRKGEAGNRNTNFRLNRNLGWYRVRPIIAETITRPQTTIGIQDKDQNLKLIISCHSRLLQEPTTTNKALE